MAYSSPFSLQSTVPARVAVVLALFGAWLAYAWPWLGGEHIIPWDNKDQFYPWMRFTVDSLRAGEWPWWNPYVYAGYPAVADPQMSLFSPLAMGLSLLAAPLGIRDFDVIVLLHALVGGLGVLLLARRLGLHPLAALLAALIYMLGGPAAARLQHSPMIFVLAYVPFAIYFLDRLLAHRRYGDGLLAGIFAGLVALHENQVAYLFVWVLAAFFLFRVATARGQTLRERIPPGPLLVAAVAGLVAVGPQLFATLSFLPHSNRPSIDFFTATQQSVAPLAFLTFAVPDFFNTLGPKPYWGRNDVTETYLYIGIIPVLLLAGTTLLRRGWAETAETRFFAALAVFAVLFMLGRYTPVYGWLYDLLPGLSLYRRPSDASFVLNFALAFLSAFSLQQLLAGGPRVPLRPGLAALVTGAGLLVALVWGISLATDSGNVDRVARNSFVSLLLAALAVLLFRLRHVRGVGRTALPFLGLLAVADLIGHNGRMPINAHSVAAAMLFAEPAREEALLLEYLQRNLRPNREAGHWYRVEFVDMGPLWGNAPAAFRLQATQGYNPLLYARYQAVGGAQNQPLEPRPFTELNPGYDAVLMDLLGVRYVVSRSEPAAWEPSAAALPLVMEYGPYKIYENLNVYPRVLLADELRVVGGAGVLTDELETIDFRRLALVENLPPDYAPAPRDGAGPPWVVLREYTNTRVVTEVNTAHSRMLVLHDLFHPGWHAYVDGTERPIYKANLMFRGVWVPAGRHRIEFRFEPFRPW